MTKLFAVEKVDSTGALCLCCCELIEIVSPFLNEKSFMKFILSDRVNILVLSELK